MATPMNFDPKQINAKLDTIMRQSVANAHGIAQLNTNLEQYHNDSKGRLMDVENQLKAVRDDTSTIINEQVSADITRNNFDSEAKEERSKISFSTKIIFVTEALMLALMLAIVLILWKFVMVPNQELETKNSVISWYESVVEEYGLELPDFPEFPEISLNGGGNE